MIAYEFSAEVTKSRTLTIPATTAPELEAGAHVRVILLVDENDHENRYNEQEGRQNASLQQIVDEVKQMPKTPVQLQPESGLLAKHLLELELEIDPTFDVDKWLQEWDRVEMAVKQESLARESRILSEMRE
jgi:hypothetical protein